MVKGKVWGTYIWCPTCVWSVSVDQQSWKKSLWNWYCPGWMHIVLQTVSAGLEDEAVLWTYVVQMRSQGRWWYLWNGILEWFGYMLFAYVSLFSVQWYSLIVLQFNSVNKMCGTVLHYYCLKCKFTRFSVYSYEALVIMLSKFANSCFLSSCKLKGSFTKLSGKVNC
jgi:hypothetical protein